MPHPRHDWLRRQRRPLNTGSVGSIYDHALERGAGATESGNRKERKEHREHCDEALLFVLFVFFGATLCAARGFSGRNSFRSFASLKSFLRKTRNARCDLLYDHGECSRVPWPRDRILPRSGDVANGSGLRGKLGRGGAWTGRKPKTERTTR